jgi:hypothetical protein
MIGRECARRRREGGHVGLFADMRDLRANLNATGKPEVDPGREQLTLFKKKSPRS